MNSFLPSVSLLAVLGCAKSADRRVTGAEGGSVEITCPYQDGYQYSVKYWCRHPCGNKDVLIRTGKTDTVVTAGRFNLINSVSAKTFTVWMNRLTLQDSGVYYCGVEEWGRDTLTKTHLSVSEVVPTTTTPSPTSSPTSSPTPSPTPSPSSDPLEINGTDTTASNNSTQTPASAFTGAGVHISLAAALGVIVCVFMVAVIFLFKKRRQTHSLIDTKPTTTPGPASPVQEEDDPGGEYEEIDTSPPDCDVSTVYSTICGPLEVDSPELYSIVPLSNPQLGPEDCDDYSLLKPH